MYKSISVIQHISGHMSRNRKDLIRCRKGPWKSIILFIIKALKESGREETYINIVMPFMTNLQPTLYQWGKGDFRRLFRIVALIFMVCRAVSFLFLM